jgi:hypothetical protein
VLRRRPHACTLAQEARQHAQADQLAAKQAEELAEVQAAMSSPWLAEDQSRGSRAADPTRRAGGEQQ